MLVLPLPAVTHRLEGQLLLVSTLVCLDKQEARMSTETCVVTIVVSVGGRENTVARGR